MLLGSVLPGAVSPLVLLLLALLLAQPLRKVLPLLLLALLLALPLRKMLPLALLLALLPGQALPVSVSSTRELQGVWPRRSCTGPSRRTTS